MNGYIGSYCGNLCTGLPQPFPERLQGRRAATFADKDHGPGIQVQDDRQIAVTMADADLVDSQMPQVPQRYLGGDTIKSCGRNKRGGVT